MSESKEIDKPLLTTPLSQRGWPVWVVYTLAALGALYLLNPTAGILEFLPDNIPFIGNLDEGAAFMLVWAGLLEFFEGRKYRSAPPETPNSQPPTEDNP